MTPKILILKYQSGHGSSITPPSGDGLQQEFSSLLARHKAGRCNSVPYGSIKLMIGMTLPSLNLIRQEPQVSDMLSLTLSLRSRLTFLDLLAVWPGSLQNFEVFFHRLFFCKTSQWLRHHTSCWRCRSLSSQDLSNHIQVAGDPQHSSTHSWHGTWRWIPDWS